MLFVSISQSHVLLQEKQDLLRISSYDLHDLPTCLQWLDKWLQAHPKHLAKWLAKWLANHLANHLANPFRTFSYI